MMRSILPPNTLPTEYGDLLWNKVLPCNRVYGEYGLKRVFIECLLKSIRQSMESHSCRKKSATVTDLEGHATLLTKLQRVAVYRYYA